MASRPTPFSIALSSLIALHCEQDSPLYAGGGAEQQQQQGFLAVDAFLQKYLTLQQGGGVAVAITTSNNNSHAASNYSINTTRMQWASGHAPPVRHLIQALEEWTASNNNNDGNLAADIASTFFSWLKVAASSINALTDLMTTIYQTVRSGVVDASSVNGMYVRSVCLGFEELSFESTSLLWTDFRREINHAAAAKSSNSNDDDDEHHENEYSGGGDENSSSEQPTLPLDQQWPLSAEQMESVLRNQCLETSRNASSSLDEMQMGIAQVLQGDPELPSAHFLRFLNCIQSGERVGAVDALHSYFDYALIQKDNHLGGQYGGSDDRQQLLQFAAILLAAMYHQTGDHALSLLATEEAVRVAQQSQDTACVAFALGWLFENEIGSGGGARSGGSSAAGELIQRCVQRAVEGNLRPLACGSNLSQVQHSLTLGRGAGAVDGGGGNANAAPSLVWTQLMDASTDPASAETASSHHSHLDRPTHMAFMRSGDEALQILSRQRMVAAAIWDAFGQTASSGLASFVALYCHSVDQILPVDVIVAVQNMARVALCGSVSSVLSPDALDGGVLFKYTSLLVEKGNADAAAADDDKENACVYADALIKIVRLRQSFRLPVKGVFTHDIALILHEWAVRRGDYHHAELLMLLLQSDLHPGMANFVQTKIDVYTQKCLLLSRQGRWDEAKMIAKSQINACAKTGLHAQQARLLLQLALIHLESSPPHQFTTAMPSLLECLTLCDKYGMHGIHAVALSVLGQVHLRKHNPKQAIAVLQASLPTILQEEHVWFQAEAFLTLAKCRLARAKSESNQGKNTVSIGILRSAGKDLLRSEQLFRKCHDGQRLQEIYYLQARLFNSLPDAKLERDGAARKFLNVKSSLTRTMTPVTDGFAQSLSNDSHLEHLAARNYPTAVETVK